MTKKKRKKQKGLLLAVLAGLLISIMLASSRLSKDQPMDPSTRATEGQTCVSQIYTYYGTGICVDRIKLICRDIAIPENGVNCKIDPKDTKTVTCDFSSYNKEAKNCVNPTTLKTMIRDICGCRTEEPLPTQRSNPAIPTTGVPY
ncbi:MAG: hypothetical protein UZ21_OP11001000235 [Microgenomates bacterium OLB22]|nr:MAG: hypothetical protein UZ21_OP11001000235 [Microgenomates bacterium OLB22]